MRCLLSILALASSAASAAVLDYSAFRTPAQVDAAMTQLQTTYPTLVRIVQVGAVNGTPIRALKISTTPDVDDPTKGDAVFVALHHAREWIAVETALYIADELLARRSTDSALAADLNRLQVWVIPVVNPEGYAFTRTMGNRLWRKNRRNNLDGSFGVDINRNYAFQYGLSGFDPVDGRSINVSTTTTNDSYIGTSAFSEAETSSMRDFLLARQNLKFFITYHSYHGLMLRPWSYTGAQPPGELFLKAISDRSRALIQSVHGISFGEDISYHSSGEATDWVWNTLRAAAFTPELRPRACLLDPDPGCTVPLGQTGDFDPSPAQILPNNEEQFPAARALIHDAARTGLWIKDHPDDDGSEPSARPTSGGGWTRPFWQSPDIRTEPVVLNGGATVRLFARVRNETGVAQTGVRVFAYYTDPRIALEFPSPTSIEIGNTTVTVPAAGLEVEFAWTIPNTLNAWGEAHWCVGVVIMHDSDMPLSSQIQKTSNIGARNFETVITSLAGSFLLVAADNFLAAPVELTIHPNPELVKQGWRVEPVLPEFTRQLTPSTQRKARLLDVKGHVLEAGQSIVVPVRVVPPAGIPAGTEVTVQLDGLLRPLIAGSRPTMGNGFTYRVRVENR